MSVGPSVDLVVGCDSGVIDRCNTWIDLRGVAIKACAIPAWVVHLSDS